MTGKSTNRQGFPPVSINSADGVSLASRAWHTESRGNVLRGAPILTSQLVVMVLILLSRLLSTELVLKMITTCSMAAVTVTS